MSLTDNSLEIKKYDNTGTFIGTDSDRSTDHIVKNTEHINAKTRELYQLPGSIVDTSKSQYSQTMMAGVMWTVLATSLAYYVFNEL